MEPFYLRRNVSGGKINKGSCMRWFGKAGFSNETVALVAVLAWFTGTNHCLLGFLKGPQNAAVSMCHCQDHSKKSRGAGNGPSAMLACCQGLQSSSVEVAKTKIAFSPVLAAIQLFAIGILILPETPKSILIGTEYDTGPPLPGSFVGTVLKRSLRENAPPVVS
jgi:hypothetical protein